MRYILSLTYQIDHLFGEEIKLVFCFIYYTIHLLQIGYFITSNCPQNFDKRIRKIKNKKLKLYEAQKRLYQKYTLYLNLSTT